MPHSYGGVRRGQGATLLPPRRWSQPVYDVVGALCPTNSAQTSCAATTPPSDGSVGACLRRWLQLVCNVGRIW